MTTLKDVAKYLGVSVSTVSRVVNGFERVDPETRETVKAAMKELNYQPNENARRLKSNRSDVLGVVIPDITNPFFANIVRGVENAAAENNFKVLLCDTNGDAKVEQRSVELLTRQKVAGIISASVASNKEAEKIYGNPDVRVVFVDNAPDINADYSSVIINNFQAAKELTEILLDRGHRRICMISGPKNESSATERLNGYIAAFKERNLPVEENNILFGDYRLDSGMKLMSEFLKTNVKPTAVLAANNFMAYGAMHSIIAEGLSVPRDIEIATFDVVDYTGLVKDKLLSANQPAFDIGRVSAEICIDETKKDMVKSSCKIVLKHSIDI